MITFINIFIYIKPCLLPESYRNSDPGSNCKRENVTFDKVDLACILA